MFYSERRLLALILVTVCSWSRCTHCASLTSNTDQINWASRPPNATGGREGRQQKFSDTPNFNSNVNNYQVQRDHTNVNLNGGGVDPQSSSFSITPSVSYQFHTNDHEHLDRIVVSHQNSAGNSFSESSGDKSGSASSASESATLRRSDVVPELQRPSASYPGFDFSVYQQHQNQAYSNNAQPQESQGWENKQHLSSPKVVSQEKHVSQEAQVDELRDNDTRMTNPSSSHLRQPSFVKSAEIRNNSTRFVYSRPQKNPRDRPNGGPITYQGQQPKQPVHTAGSYSSVDVSTVRSMSAGGKPAITFSREKQPGGKRQILQSRADTYEQDEEGAAAGQEEEEEDPDHGHYYEHEHADDSYGQGQGESYDPDHDHDDSENEYYYGNAANGHEGMEEDPALRDFGQGKPTGGAGGFGGGPPGPLVGPGPGGPPGLPPPPGPFGGPIPPPPVPLKGSIDYILIPLILIGLAGPIFVVLYVILGGFEYKLAPITRSFKSSFIDYQPYIDSLTSSVGRALEKYDCPNYATCRLKGFCNELGLQSSTARSIETALSSVTPKEYVPTLNSVFSLLKKSDEEEDCSQYQCSSLVDSLPVKF